MKGLVTRVINASKLNENEKERNDSNRRRKACGEQIGSNPKKKNTYNVTLFCFLRVGKTWFLVQFGVNKRGLIFKDNKIAQPVI